MRRFLRLRSGDINAGNHLLGISEQAGALFRKWVGDFLEVGISDQETMMRTVAEVKVFFEEEIQKRRNAPRDDLISYLLDAKIDGQPLSQEHINGTLRLLLFVGIDTTWSADYPSYTIDNSRGWSLTGTGEEWDLES